MTVMAGPGGQPPPHLAQDQDFESRLAAGTLWRSRTTRLLVVTDLAAVGLGVLAAYLGRFVAAGDFSDEHGGYALLALGLASAWMGALASARAYDTRILGVGTEDVPGLVDGFRPTDDDEGS